MEKKDIELLLRVHSKELDKLRESVDILSDEVSRFSYFFDSLIEDIQSELAAESESTTSNAEL